MPPGGSAEADKEQIPVQKLITRICVPLHFLAIRATTRSRKASFQLHCHSAKWNLLCGRQAPKTSLVAIKSGGRIPGVRPWNCAHDQFSAVRQVSFSHLRRNHAVGG